MLLLTVTRSIFARIPHQRPFLLLALFGASFLFSAHSTFALPASPGKVPNGSVFSCNTCHVPDPAPKSQNTQMKIDFLTNTPTKTWTAPLANKDSDSDGFTNGEELQDFDGTWVMGQPDPGSAFYVSNPSVSGSVPVAPVVSGVGNFFGELANGSVSFFVLIDFHALPIDRVEYTIRDHNNTVVFSAVATDPSPPFSYLSGQWDTTQVPNGAYVITAEVVEKRNKPGVTPRRGVASDSFTVSNVQVSFSSSFVSVNESAGLATLMVRLSEPATQFVAVDYETAVGTAGAGSDYTSSHGTIEFDVGESSRTINVPILNDQRDEANETFAVTLFGASGAGLISPAKATVTIVDDDPPPAVKFSGSYSAHESAGNVTVTVQLSTASDRTVKVHYATSDGTATSSADYVSKVGTLTFNPGQTSKTFDITIVNDNLYESDETVGLVLSSPVNAMLGTPAVSILTLGDDDAAPLPVVDIVASDASTAEVGTDSGTFTITRSGSTVAALKVKYMVGGTATPALDYTALLGTVVIAAGQSSVTIVVTPLDDTAAEGDETVIVTLSPVPTYAVGALGSATITVRDNDPGQAQQHKVYVPLMARADS